MLDISVGQQLQDLSEFIDKDYRFLVNEPGFPWVIVGEGAAELAAKTGCRVIDLGMVASGIAEYQERIMAMSRPML